MVSALRCCHNAKGVFSAAMPDSGAASAIRASICMTPLPRRTRATPCILCCRVFQSRLLRHTAHHRRAGRWGDILYRAVYRVSKHAAMVLRRVTDNGREKRVILFLSRKVLLPYSSAPTHRVHDAVPVVLITEYVGGIGMDMAPDSCYESI